MAQVDPIGGDNVMSDYDDKENFLQNNNVFPRTPCTEKGYEELDVSELNMKLRYSFTPVSSPMSQSYTANCTYRGSIDPNNLNSAAVCDNINLTRSLNCSLTKDNILKSAKAPLQVLSTSQFIDDKIITPMESFNAENNVNIIVTGNDTDDDISLPSTSSSVQTLRPTTPTTDIPKNDGGSPIMRGLKSVLNMFRPSHTPTSSSETITIHDDIYPKELTEIDDVPLKIPPASTPVTGCKVKDINVSRRNSPLKESVIFNDDLERELQWKDDIIHISKEEKNAVHKTFHRVSSNNEIKILEEEPDLREFKKTVDYMDVSNLDVSYKSSIEDKTIDDIDLKVVLNNEVSAIESDSEFLDCETTYLKNESYVLNNVESFHKTMPVVVDISHVALEGSLEDYINCVSNNEEIHNNTESVEQKLDTEVNNKAAVLIGTYNLTSLTPAFDDPKHLPVYADLNLPSIKNTNKSSPADDIQSINLASELTIDNNAGDIHCVLGMINSYTCENNEVLDDYVSSTSENYFDSNNKEGNFEYIKKPESACDLNMGNRDLQNIYFTVEDIGQRRNKQINKNMSDIYHICQIDENIVNNECIDQVKKQMLVCNEGVTSCVLEAHQDKKLSVENNNVDAIMLCKKDTVEFSNINASQIPTNDNILNITVTIDSAKSESDLPDTSQIKYNMSIDKLDISNVNCVEKSLFNDELHMDIDRSIQNEETVPVIDFHANSDNVIVNEDHLHNFDKDQDVSATDITMNSLKIDTNETNKIDTHGEIEFVRLKEDNNCLSIESINNLASEKRLLNDNIVCNQVKNNMDIGISCIQIENAETHEIIDQSLVNQATGLNGCLFVTESFNNILIPAKCDIEITAEKAIFNQKISNDKKFEITYNNDTDKTEAIILPDIITAINEASEKEFQMTQKTTTYISNEFTSIEVNVKSKGIDEEILTTAISVTDMDPSFNVPAKEINLKNKTKVLSPISPKCNRKGYNINFDEIDNPFATKTNIRMTPPPETLLKNSNIFLNKQTNADHERTTNRLNRDEGVSNVTQTSNDKTNPSALSANLINVPYPKPSIDLLQKETNSRDLEHSNNYSSNYTVGSKIETKMIDNCNANCNTIQQHFNKQDPETKSVFNLPEIFDKTFNPNEMSSSLKQGLKDTAILENNVINIKPKCETSYPTEISNIAVNIKDTIHDVSHDVSNTTSRNSDEVHTEDEVTIEGPFFKTEDLEDHVKVSDFKIEKVMHFEDIPATVNNEDIGNGELFIDAETFDVLMNHKSNVVIDSGKESLFLKFDPLFAKRVSSDGVLAALSSMQKKQSTPKKLIKTPFKNEPTPNENSSATGFVLEENNQLFLPDEIGNSVTKPTMVVNPAVSSNVTPKKSTTPPNINRQSLSFTSPAMMVIDRLLSQNDNVSLLDQDDLMPCTSRNHDAVNVLTQFRELLAEKDVYVQNLKCETMELKEKLFTLDSQIKSVESKSEEKLRKINNLNELLIEKTKSNKAMAAVVEEYEKTIATLIIDVQQERKQKAEERARLINERDELTAHLTCMERSFNDLHSKYEKSKQTLFSMKANEDTAKKLLKELDANLLKMNKNYEQLKQHATSKLNHANQELDKINRMHQNEVTKLTAVIKCKELNVKSLEESLAQQIKANEDLTAICDELISKVG